jgi:CRISPR system Cascade subunit CasC
MLIEFHILQSVSLNDLRVENNGSQRVCLFGESKRAWVSCHTLKQSVRAKALHRNADSEPLAKDSVLASSAAGCRFDRTLARTGSSAAISDEIMSIMDGILSDTPHRMRRERHCDKARQSMDAAKLSSVFDIALYGKKAPAIGMPDIEPSAHVAHAISTSCIEQPIDFFRAADALESPAGDTPADRQADCDSVCFYRYSSLDFDSLSRNLSSNSILAGLEDDAPEPVEMQRKALEAFILPTLETSLAPSGKKSPLPDSVLIEMRPFPVPVSYASAFVQPIQQSLENLAEESLDRMLWHADKVATEYNLETSRRILFAPNTGGRNGFLNASRVEQLFDFVWEGCKHG